MSFRERLTDRDVFELRCVGAVVLLALVGACGVLAWGMGALAWALAGGSFAVAAASLFHHALYEGARSGAHDVRDWCRRFLGMKPAEVELAEADEAWRRNVAAFLAELESDPGEATAISNPPSLQSVWTEGAAFDAE